MAVRVPWHFGNGQAGDARDARCVPRVISLGLSSEITRYLGMPPTTKFHWFFMATYIVKGMFWTSDINHVDNSKHCAAGTPWERFYAGDEWNILV